MPFLLISQILKKKVKALSKQTRFEVFHFINQNVPWGHEGLSFQSFPSQNQTTQQNLETGDWYCTGLWRGGGMVVLPAISALD